MIPSDSFSVYVQAYNELCLLGMHFISNSFTYGLVPRLPFQRQLHAFRASGTPWPPTRGPPQ